jgi:hypothetical protein
MPSGLAPPLESQLEYARQDSNLQAGFQASRSLRASLRRWSLNSNTPGRTRTCRLAFRRRDPFGPLSAAGASTQIRPAGLEPATLGSEDRCSIQLSYGRVWVDSSGFVDGVRGRDPPAGQARRENSDIFREARIFPGRRSPHGSAHPPRAPRRRPRQGL